MKLTILFVIASCLCYGLLPSINTQAPIPLVAFQQPGGSTSTVSTILAAAVAKSHVPGIAAVIVRSSGIVEVGVAGVRKNGFNDPIQRGDLFHLGSNTKAMTATLIARWVERGQLAWTTRPIDVFSDMRGKINPAFVDITLTDLLNHHAGIASFKDGGAAEFRDARKAAGSGSPTEQRREFTYWLLQRPPDVEPRTKMQYSNAGYAVAAAMLEKVAGKSWESLMVADLWEPLGIRSGGFGWPGRGNETQQPWGHWRQDERYVPHDPNGTYHVVDFMAAGGAVRMSITDYGRFLQMHLQGLAGRNTILKAQTVRALHTPIDGSAFGWGVGRESHGHNGSGGTFWATVKMWPRLDLAVAVATNAADDSVRIMNAADDSVRIICSETVDRLKDYTLKRASK